MKCHCGNEIEYPAFGQCNKCLEKEDEEDGRKPTTYQQILNDIDNQEKESKIR